MDFYQQSVDTSKYLETRNLFLDQIRDDPDELNNIAWDYYQQYDDKDDLKLAVELVERSIELNSNYANNDTYAALLFKLGKYEASLKQAEIAISIARENGNNFDETTQLIERIMQKMQE
jgi:thioredoxin 1